MKIADSLIKNLLLALICILFLHITPFVNEANALAPRLASQSILARREMRAHFERTRVIYPELDSEDKRLLEVNNAKALLLSHGKYLVSKDVYGDDIKLIRVIMHEDIEALMQILHEKDSYRYNGIKDLIYSQEQVLRAYKNLVSESESRYTYSTYDLQLNDIVANAFELIYVTDSKYIHEEDLTEQERKFLSVIKPVISKNRYNYFLEDFWNELERQKKIVQALKNGKNFYQTAAPRKKTREINENGKGQTLIGQERFVRWYHNGNNLKPGNVMFAFVDLGGKKTFVGSGGRKATFSFNIPDKEGKKEIIAFVAEADSVHGLIVNCYPVFFEDKIKKGRSESSPVINKNVLIAAFKRSSLSGKAEKIDLAAADISHAFYAFGPWQKSIYSRQFRTVVTANETIDISVSKAFNVLYPPVRIDLSKNEYVKEKLKGREVVVMVEKDANHGEVINIYLAENYDNKTDSPVATYKYIRNKNKSNAIPVNLARMDIIKVCEGGKLKIFGREYIKQIIYSDGKQPISQGIYIGQTRTGKKVSFWFPGEFVSKIKTNISITIKVENDINRKQVINIYAFSEGNKEELQQPISVYKYFPNKTTKNNLTDNKEGTYEMVNLAALDIKDYYRGNTSIKAVLGREVEMPVCYEKNKKGYWYTINAKIKGDRFKIFLSSAAKEIFSPKEKNRKVLVRIKEHPDYGAYIEVSKAGQVLAHYYYYEEQGKCGLINFPVMAFMDYVEGNKNVHKKSFTPKILLQKGRVRNYNRNGKINIEHKGRKITVSYLNPLIGKRPVFVPVEHEEYGYVIHVHAAEEYIKNNKRKPEVVLVRNSYFGKLVPIKRFDEFWAREIVCKDLFPGADKFNTLNNNKKNRLYAKAREYSEDRGTVFDGDKFIFYLNILKDAIAEDIRYNKNKSLKYFRNLASVSRENGEKIITELIRRLNFSEISEESSHANIAILNILTELPNRYKDNPGAARKISEYFDYRKTYKKICGKNLENAISEFFKSIPDDLVFYKKIAKRNNGIKDKKGEKQRRRIIQYTSGNMVNIYREEMNHDNLLTELGEIKLSVLVQLGDEEARETFIKSNLRLVAGLAWDYCLDKSYMADAVSEGNVVLIKSVELFRPQDGYRFSSYATMAVKQEIKRYLKYQVNQVRVPEGIQNIIWEFERKCFKKGLDPYLKTVSDEEIAEAIKIKKDKVAQIRRIRLKLISLNESNDKEDDESEYNRANNETAQHDPGFIAVDNRRVVDSILEGIIKRTINTLNGRDKSGRLVEIFKLRYFPLWGKDGFEISDPMVLEDIGLLYGFSREWANRLAIQGRKSTQSSA